MRPISEIQSDIDALGTPAKDTPEFVQYCYLQRELTRTKENERLRAERPR